MFSSGLKIDDKRVVVVNDTYPPNKARTILRIARRVT